jgi:aryl-alcohol dehydrogenase-like predicted oxidoreductase
LKEILPLDKRILGRTGLAVSALGLGTVELGLDYGIKVPGAYGRPAESEAIQLVHAAIDAGINLIDTARAYGESEAVLGRALRDRRDRVVLATKTTTVGPDGSPLSGTALQDHMRLSLETSLKQLQTDYIDLWQIHNVDETLLTQREAIAAVFDDVRQRGQVRSVGGSTYGVAAPLAALKTDLFDALQVTYSVLDQRLADTIFPLAVKQNVGLLVRSILLQGVLTERGDHLPDRLAVLRERSQQFRQLIATEPGASPAQMAIAFGLAQPQISSVLVGVRTEAELAEDLAATRLNLSSALLTQLSKLRLDDPDLLNPGTWQLT